MPTGYTDILKDSNVTFEQFATRCMRAFGACVMQRDDNMDNPPELQKPSDYHIKNVKKEKKKLYNLKKKSVQSLTIKALKDFQRSYKQRLEWLENKRKLRKNYEYMLEQVNKFVPPTKDHENFKKFMIEQIQSSIKYDCDEEYSLREMNNLVNEIVNFKFKEYKGGQIKDIEKDIEYHKKEYKEEVNRTNSRNKWIIDCLDEIKKVI